MLHVDESECSMASRQASIQKVAGLTFYIQDEGRILRIWRQCVLSEFSNVVWEPKGKDLVSADGILFYMFPAVASSLKIPFFSWFLDVQFEKRRRREMDGDDMT